MVGFFGGLFIEQIAANKVYFCQYQCSVDVKYRSIPSYMYFTPFV